MLSPPLGPLLDLTPSTDGGESGTGAGADLPSVALSGECVNPSSNKAVVVVNTLKIL